MAIRGKSGADSEKPQVEGHSVEIRKSAQGNDALWIDGVRHKFFVTKDGYTLHADAYAPPHKSLLDAVKSFLRPRGPKAAD